MNKLIQIALLLAVIIAPMRAQVLFLPGSTGGIAASQNGNVGVGTDNPLWARMEVSQSSPASWALKLRNTGTGAPGLLLWGFADSTDPNSALLDIGSAAGAQLFMKGDGKVGIGTVTPGYTLEVASQEMALSYAGTADAGMRFIDQSRVWKLGINILGAGVGKFSLWDGTANADRLTVDTSGNVGIGTTNPIDRLQITNDGDVRVVLRPAGGANNRESIVDFWSTFDNYAADVAPRRVARIQAGFDRGVWGSEYIAFGVGGSNDYDGPPTEKMRIASGGNVGIGTSAPTHKLSVNGAVRAKEVIVDTGWPDYVFADDYRLAPLSEVERHIKVEKHLPGIPSAAEVAKEGVSVGEMQAKLLAKIEELTLHQIEQEKRWANDHREIEALRAENARLREQVHSLAVTQSSP